MSIETVAILSPGEMGSGVGRAFAEHGFTVITTLEGRGAATRERALAAGFQDGGSLADVVAAADIVLSILPPEFALPQAVATAAAMTETGKFPSYADCNAVAPETAMKIGQIIAEAGAECIDGGIVGSPPRAGLDPARLYVSGPGAAAMAVFDGKGISVRQCGPEIGRGSSVKMAYAGITKGTSALHAAMLIAAERLGVADVLHDELQSSQQVMYKRMENMTPALPAVSDRYVGEMLEIAKTMAGCDLPAGFHEGAADLYRLLDASPFSSERRDTVDKSRGFRKTIEVCAQIPAGKAAAE
jgi:3-hydroxyisobutyrate dehydrogenase-like beta-hydroxyacid dehydrogenase